MAAETEVVKSFINIWLSIHSLTPYFFSIIIYLLAGMLTKFILINSGDFNYRHTFYNEGLYRKKDETSTSSIGCFDLKLKLKQAIVNPPLRISIAVFLTIIYSTNDIEIKSYFNVELVCYLIGLNIPQFIKSIRSSLATQPLLDLNSEEPNTEFWYQNEKPVLTLKQDRLNRGELVNRLLNVITSNENVDTRGIAIIGPFGIGKSSLINMTLSEIQMAFHNYIPCRINSWGTYSSEEQIQKYLIEQVINSLDKVTSTTSLSGLPSKYISSLKGAQSLWLDTLPLFYNHSSPRSQLTEIDNLLEKINLKVIIILEDLDRNIDAEAMLNSIAPLIDRLNENGNFRFILSIGEKLNNPNIVNRICRYKEYLSQDRSYVLNSIKESLHSTLKKKKLAYTGDISYFFQQMNLKVVLYLLEMHW
ncbi:P-loop NTPase fold protein [Aeromonas hydrophila]|uniref:P-loop NTPase fold protein n=1 Tax=Aeromonas hydrophila TaxID=644 RepID=UPI000F532632|nr:P-loop NTPase fold protein [Aeromonas hydrophila]RQM70012.1 hypothetical protein EHZ82_09430 [Aeromonas hydrophila]